MKLPAPVERTLFFAMTFALCVAGIGGLAVPALAASAASAPPAPPATLPTRERALAVAVPFVENLGQSDPSIRYQAALRGGAFGVTGDGRMIYRLGSATFVERFDRGTAMPRGAAPTAARIARFVGDDPAEHRTNLPTYERVELGEVFAGVRVTLRATGRNVEKIFTVAPGADPGAIAMTIDAATAMRTGSGGTLRVAGPEGEVEFTAPIAYQDIAGTRRPVEVAYAIEATRGTYGFAVGRYDRAHPLVIDPLLRSTYLGAGDEDWLTAIAVHQASGDVYVAGWTVSTNLIATGGAQSTHAGSGNIPRDGLIARYSADLTQLKQLTYLGGSGRDEINALVVHPVNGDIYVAGRTSSTNFPCASAAVTPTCQNGAQAVYGGGTEDGFIARLSPELTQLKQATFIGGGADDVMNAIAVHPASGEVIAAGWTLSLNFPCTVSGGGCAGAAQLAHWSDGGQADGVVARVSADLRQFLQATYFGHDATDVINAVAVHPHLNHIVVAGFSNSSNLSCRAMGLCFGGAVPDRVADYDGFIARFSVDLLFPHQATWFGGSATDYIRAMAISPTNGEVIVGGITTSNNLPCIEEQTGLCRPGAQQFFGGSFDGFIARFSGELTRLRQATYFGSGGAEDITALLIHPATGEIYAAGSEAYASPPCVSVGGECGIAMQATSTDSFLPADGFIVRMTPDLRVVKQATLLGGNGADSIHAITVHPASNELLVAGRTVSTIFPGTAGSPQPAHAADGGLNDGFVARMTPDLTLADTTPSLAFAPVNNAPLLTLTTSAPAQLTGIGADVRVYVEGAANSAYCLSSTHSCSCNLSGGFVSTPGTASNNAYVCVRHQSAAIANLVTETTFHAGGGAAVFRASTGALLGSGGGAGGCTLDVDGNSAVDALTDGLMLIRAMFGLTGTSVTNNAVGSGAPRTTWAQIRSHLNGNCGTTFAP